jgi:hypothetical protein
MTVRCSRNKYIILMLFTAIFLMMLAVPMSSAGQNEAKGKSPDAILHAELVEVADAWIAKQAPLAATDPLRPIYHMRTPANWFNDPHGAVFYDGNYHIFMQHAVFQLNTGMDRYYYDIPKTEPGLEYATGVSGMKGWAHMVSKDLVYWEHWPTALVPSPRSYDRPARPDVLQRILSPVLPEPRFRRSSRQQQALGACSQQRPSALGITAACSISILRTW